ncbi:MAG: tetratricopeptide repeat protein [Deltaproteobacteria bacterium]|nr:tetratricopeptide repeat protein [Deltaproteobacteria bacterium]
MGGRRKALHRMWVAALVVALACTPGLDDQLAEARRASEAGRPQEAIALLRSVLEREPEHEEANFRLGAALVAAGDSSLAIPRLRRALDSEAYAEEAGVLLASAFFAGQNFEEAAAAAGRVLEGRPDHPGALRLRANARLHMGDAAGCVEDAALLAEATPDDPQPFILSGTCLAGAGRMNEAERTFLRAQQAVPEDDALLRGSACAALANFYEAHLRDAARAEDRYDACLVTDPAHGTLLQAAAAFYERAGKPEKSRAALRRAVEAAPDDLGLRRAWSMLRVREGAGDEALAELERVARRLDSAAAWSLLASFYRERGDAASATAALENALQRATGDPGPMRFALADSLVDLGRMDEAQRLADTAQPEVYSQLIRGRILLVQGDASGALEAFDRGLSAWPNNAGARFLAGQAAEQQGLLKRALFEYRESTRAEPGSSDAALHAAYMALALGQPDEAIAFARRHATHRTGRLGEAVVVAARAQQAKGEPATARRGLELWIEGVGPDPLVVATLAELEAGAEGVDAGIARTGAVGLDLGDPANVVVLRTRAQLLVQADRADDALGEVDAALARNPQEAALHDLRARILSGLGRSAEAEAALTRTLEIDPDYAPALAARGELLVQAGRVEEGFALIDRASASGSADIGFRAAQLATALGRKEDARRRLEAVLARHPGHAGAANDLAWALLDEGDDPERALALAERAAARLRSAQILDTLGRAYLAAGKTDQALSTLKEAAQASPDEPGIHYRLGLALARAGEPEAAESELRRALELAPFPEEESARRELAQLEEARPPR